MFTGIIKEVGKVTSIQSLKSGRKMAITCELAQNLQVDQSICINGVCHTVIDIQNSSFDVQSVKETLKKTNIGHLKNGDRVNLEPSLRADQPIDGHLVQGHTDTTGKIESIQRNGDDRIFRVSYSDEFKELVVPRGSIALNGISLTVAAVQPSSFKVAIIPYTFDHTTMKDINEGDYLNLEFDILGKYVTRWMEQHH